MDTSWNSPAGLMAIGQAFSQLRDNGGVQQTALPMIIQARKDEADKQKLASSLQAARQGGALPNMNDAQFAALAEANPKGLLDLMAKPDPWAGTKIVGDNVLTMGPGGPQSIYSAPKAPGYRDATPAELAKYGAKAGQVNEATGKFSPINPATGMRMESDGAGGFTFAQGPGVGGGDLTKRTMGDLEGKEFESRDTLARLGNIEENLANPDFMESLTATGRLKQWGLEWADTLDPKLLSPEQAEYLSGVASARGDVLENVNFTIKAITGAAMTEAEAKRIGATLPQVSDSPTVFRAKLNRTITRTRAAVARYHLWRTKGAGGKPETFETLGNVENQMNSRAAELKAAVESGEMDATAASAKFRLEFGV